MTPGEVSLQPAGEQTPLGLVTLVVVLDEDRLVGVVHVAVHLEEGDIRVRQAVEQVGFAMLHVHGFRGIGVSLFQQCVVVGRPNRVDGQAGNPAVAVRQRGPVAKLLDDLSVEAAAVVVPVVFVLCEGNEVVLLVHVQFQVGGDVAQQPAPVHKSSADRHARTNEQRGLVVEDGFREVPEQLFVGDFSHDAILYFPACLAALSIQAPKFS